MKKIIKYFLLGFLLIVLLGAAYFFFGSPTKAEDISWGVVFSQKHSSDLGLDWKENYSALLNDLGAKRLKIAAHWDLMEPEKNSFYFDDLDFQVEAAQEQGAEILLAVGMKTPRWPECHVPEWAKGLSQEEQQERILAMLTKAVKRYKDSPAVRAWQVENEPFFPFGDCPWVDKEFLKKEIALVKSLDSQDRPVVITDSGEGSFWFTAAKLGDMVGTTLYRKVWIRQLGIYFTYPFNPTFYWRKAQIVRKLFNKEVIVVELQAEPWGPKLLYDSPLEEQEKTMNLERFKGMVDFAERTGLREFYLWGSEWWWWMKEKQDKPEIWEEAQKLF